MNNTTNSTTETVKYTNEELEMFLSDVNHKTLKSVFLTKWGSFKLQVRWKIADLVGILRQNKPTNKMKNTQATKFIEDLLQEDEIDIIALSNAKFKHPIKTWLNFKFFLLGVFIKEQRLNIRLFVKKLMNSNK